MKVKRIEWRIVSDRYARALREDQIYCPYCMEDMKSDDCPHFRFSVESGWFFRKREEVDLSSFLGDFWRTAQKEGMKLPEVTYLVDPNEMDPLLDKVDTRDIDIAIVRYTDQEFLPLMEQYRPREVAGFKGG